MVRMNLSDEEAERVRASRAAPEGGHRLPTLADYADPNRPWGQSPAANPPVVKRLPDPREWVERQQRGATSVGQANYLDGIRSPKKDPIQAGIDSQDAYTAAMRDPAILARRVTGLQRTNINEWAAKAEAVGAGRYAEGVVASRPKLERGVESYHSFLTGHLATIDRLPNATVADRNRRVLENLNGLRAFKNQRR
mgnify:FL=1